MPTNKNARVWTGTEWANISAPVAVPNAIAYYQSTAPSSPSTGQVWVNSTTETFYVWSGSAWEQQNVDLSAYLTSATAASTYVSAATVASTYAPKASPVFTGTVDASNANFVPPVQTSGRNRIINGSFDVWQRGTSFDMASDGTYTADRWLQFRDGTGVTRSITRQAMPLNAIPGYQFNYFLRFATTVAGTGNTYNVLDQRIENAHVDMSNLTYTLSFWAKADSARTINTYFVQYFGVGGSADTVSAPAEGQSVSLTTSWQRFTKTITVASASGKTIGTNPFGYIRFAMPPNAICSVDITGIQMEKGSAATPFEFEQYADILRKCQRYYQRFKNDSAAQAYAIYGFGICQSTTAATIAVALPTRMRIPPTLGSDFSNLHLTDYVSGFSISGMVLGDGNNEGCAILNPTSSGLTQYRPIFIRNNNNANGYFGLSAEL